MLLVDDHEVVLLGLRSLLSDEEGFWVVGTAGTADDALLKAELLQPNVVLLDIRMPEKKGLDACTKILEVSPNTKVVFLTSYADDDTILAAILAGAHGYIVKEIGTQALAQSIREVVNGGFVLDSTATKLAMDLLKKLAMPKQEPSLRSLTAKEKTVLTLVTEGHTNKEIASTLKLSEKTIKNYLATMYKKLKISRRSQAVAFYIRQPKV